ncbi:hypothetical protein [Clostridium sp.]|uniref:hypothetical protein n=1 Tax=Clostridium sp. TaxID=1506 RepID=UPI00262BC4C9|nr:hypothetical protein [Clostridium sp.]
MEAKEAIIRIKEHKDIHFKEEFPRAIKITEALELSIEALEKQIPKNVEGGTVEAFGFDWFCMCGNYLSMDKDEYIKYCPKCGQKLDWNNIDNDKLD